MNTKLHAPLTGFVLFATIHSASSQVQNPSALAGHPPAGLSAPPAGEAAAKSIPIDQLGAEAQKQYTGDGVGITPTAGGARLRAAFQDLAAEATPDGLWLESTSDEDAGKPARFRVRAVAIGREGCSPIRLTDQGQVRATGEAALYLRPGLVEEYTVSMDGVRQDFVLPQRPAGKGELSVELAVDGARAEAASGGVKLTLDGRGREIAYSRLHVADAKGRELTARLEVTDINRIQVRVDDFNATYPIRIDPTFSDADWNALGSGMNGAVYALAVSGGDLYAGGSFTTAGGVSANYIAKWNGGTWIALGSGMDMFVRALAVSGTDLYAGGEFSFAGDVNANGIAKWDGSAWSKLSTGVNGPVWALAVSGTDLYAGGSFTNASSTIGVNRIAKWNGGSWSALGSGMDSNVFALAISGTDLYAGGMFTTAGGVSARHIAKWNGSSWSPLRSGVDGFVRALAVSGTDLYVGGDFTFEGSLNHIAKWDGIYDWIPLLTGLNGVVHALAVSGNDLYAAGDFTDEGGLGTKYIAQWNGSEWSGLGSGTNGRVRALTASVTGLYAGGEFTTAGDKQAAYIAQAIKPPEPDVDVDQPVGVPLADASSSIVWAAVPVGYSAPAKTFTVRSTGTSDLALSAVNTNGGNAGDFSVDTTGMATTVTPDNSTTFTVTFTPTGPGLRSTTLQIASNDEDENPFDVTLTGTGLSFTNDTDDDGMNDASEFQMAALGFNWEAPQTALVNTLFDNVGGAQENLNAAGYFTTAQVQALHIDTPLIQRDGAGLFTLTLGLQKSSTLLPGSFQPFPFTDGVMMINGEGKIEFQFTSPDNAAFFRLRSQ